MRRLCELDKAARAQPAGGGVQPATTHAELGHKVYTGEQMGSGLRIEEFSHLAGSPVHLDRVAHGVARVRHVEVEGDFGAAWEGIVEG